MPLSNKSRIVRVAAVTALCAPAIACTQPNYLNYADRTETVTFQAGDAPAYNRVVQTQNPWPRYAKQTHIHADGERMNGAIERYKAGNVKPTESVSTE
jgi:hypothetical protein